MKYIPFTWTNKENSLLDPVASASNAGNDVNRDTSGEGDQPAIDSIGNKKSADNNHPLQNESPDNQISGGTFIAPWEQFLDGFVSSMGGSKSNTNIQSSKNILKKKKRILKKSAGAQPSLDSIDMELDRPKNINKRPRRTVREVDPFGLDKILGLNQSCGVVHSSLDRATSSGKSIPDLNTVVVSSSGTNAHLHSNIDRFTTNPEFEEIDSAISKEALQTIEIGEELGVQLGAFHNQVQMEITNEGIETGQL
ncbi:hypothetical protein L1987_05927 [Smallanthus sonchifolius]|uniref:Uncharacterized protein n=1 Tax=Smallanthus sonchifolius TaxID=185202 RepID=A0ACB9JWT8_9ASTR|nr:hypothetical protein L1987_05927 [Smallanthus sonchifolius]